MNSFYPNRLIRNDRERALVGAAWKLKDYALFYRTSRRHFFPRNFRLEGQYLPDFFKPCLAVLARENDPDKHPCLALETEDLDPDLQALYVHHSVPWSQLKTESCGEEAMIFRQGLSYMKSKVRSVRREESLADFMSRVLKVAVPVGGSCIHSHSERIFREAVGKLNSRYPVTCHHQVPVGFVLGVQPDLTFDEKKLLGSDIDAVIALRFDADPDGTVVLPVRLDIHGSHKFAAVADRDRRIHELFTRCAKPLMVISPEEGSYRFDCQFFGESGTAEQFDPDAWAVALISSLGKALRYAGLV